MQVMVMPFVTGRRTGAMTYSPTEWGEMRSLARGLSHEIARILEGWPEFEVELPSPIESEVLQQHFEDESNIARGGRLTADELEEIDPDGEIDLFLFGSLRMERAETTMTIGIVDSDGEVATSEKTFEGPTEDFPEAFGSLIKLLARDISPIEMELETSPPTYHVEAFRSYLLGLDALEMFERHIDDVKTSLPMIEAAYDHLAQALACDHEMDAVLDLVETVGEQFLDDDQLPPGPARRGLDRLIDEQLATPILIRQRGLLDMQDELPEEAAGYFRRALEAGDHPEVAYYLLARCAEMLEDWEEMDGWARQLIEESPDEPAHHLLAGVAAMRVGDNERAIENWRTALEIDPSLAMARANLAMAMLEVGDGEAAMKEIDGSLDMDDPDWRLVQSAVSILHGTGETDRAGELLDRHLGGQNLDAGEMIEAANLYWRIGREQDAGELLEQILHMSPGSDSADVAARLLCECIEPGFENAFQTIMNDVIKGDCDGHMPQLREWLTKFPFCWHIHYILGNAAWQTGDPHAAAESFEQAHELRPNYADILNRWGGVLLELGRLKEAEKRTMEALTINPEEAHALTNLALIRTYLRDFGGAKVALRLAEAIDADYPTMYVVRLAIRQMKETGSLPLPVGGNLKLDNNLIKHRAAEKSKAPQEPIKADDTPEEKKEAVCEEPENLSWMPLDAPEPARTIPDEAKNAAPAPDPEHERRRQASPEATLRKLGIDMKGPETSLLGKGLRFVRAFVNKSLRRFH